MTYPNVPGAKVHMGFYEDWLSLRSQVQAAMISSFKQCSSCNSIVVTGHSLGGAIATHAMAEVMGWFPDVPSWSYTFGSPRVGNVAFAEWYNSIQPDNYRVVNQHDIVPHVPPQKDTTYTYHHVPLEIWYPKNETTYVVCNDSGEDPSCSDSVPIYEWTGADHGTYVDLPVGCNDNLYPTI
ncbi:hypothetical protein SAMD00019534_106730 [Acytostelium subglobosum LB1]|uniref:hypothetical protein n=1 Tax=Acytostelium subglobosum LB1 TaxID=1410327 RepID=UPI0006448EAC|nr:hypothetical protein SAMD00019534_106730 [Acytostelium subglobosum LB1]GAM27497.1 hypothetical protein SAMD00019534_106730 [Acytostelium subglobosum LB1]|eukprot:XP_012749562.1 hypothetical protein SAMD00019534_106730 [Acytostelium subglobosum LB1]